MQPLERMREVWTPEDLRALQLEDWRRYEIVDGSLVVSPSAGRVHEFISEDLRAIIRASLPTGLKVIGPAGVEIGRSYRIPDLIVVRDSAQHGTGEIRPEEVLLAVEVVSPGSVTTDRVTKPAQYAAAGIPAFWRVETDPVGLTAYTLPPGPPGVPPLTGAYVEVGTWGRGETARIAEPFAIEIDIDLLGE